MSYEDVNVVTYVAAPTAADRDGVCTAQKSINSSLSPSISPSASLSPSRSPSASPSASLSPSKSPSVSPSASLSPSASPSTSHSVSPSLSTSVSPSASLSPSASFSPSISPSLSPSWSPSLSPSFSPSLSPSVSPSADIHDLVIDGALASGGIATFGEQQRVTIYSAGNLSALTFTVYGLTAFGDSISEEVTGPNNTTVSTTANFKQVTRVTSSDAVVADVEIGNSNALETPWIQLIPSWPLKGVSVQLSSGASLTYEVQYGTRKRLSCCDAETGILAKADATLTAKTASDSVAVTVPWPMARLKITSFVSGTATLRVVECPT